ncbi:MAG: hypothetical protein ACJ8AT_31250 [Hyalangium sp.]|uniref:hypothetical protein n=1 Tax=Hyalangium sp. TaxID=2028555 RepID=UPI00389A2596
MKIEYKTADQDGKFTLTAGIGFLVAPHNGPALFPIEAHPNGAANASDVLTEVREIKRGPFSKMEFWGATKGSTWLCYTLESDADSAGPAAPAGMQKLCSASLEDGETFTASASPFFMDGIIDKDGLNGFTPDSEKGRFDVRRFRGVKAVLLSESGVATVGGHCKVGMRLLSTLGTTNDPDFAWAGGAGAGFDLASGGGTGGCFSIDVGDTVAEVATTYRTGRNGRWAYVQPFVQVTTADVNVNGLFQIDLWGIP